MILLILVNKPNNHQLAKEQTLCKEYGRLCRDVDTGRDESGIPDGPQSEFGLLISRKNQYLIKKIYLEINLVAPIMQQSDLN